MRALLVPLVFSLFGSCNYSQRIDDLEYENTYYKTKVEQLEKALNDQQYISLANPSKWKAEIGDTVFTDIFLAPLDLGCPSRLEMNDSSKHIITSREKKENPRAGYYFYDFVPDSVGIYKVYGNIIVNLSGNKRSFPFYSEIEVTKKK